MTHLRGINGHTSCGLQITEKLMVLGPTGFEWAHSTYPPSVCVTCLNKSVRLRKVINPRPTLGIPMFPEKKRA